MATLVLTAVGSIFGGPIGAAIGAAVGQQVDTRLFAPKGRKGPRLGDLAVQSSAYGAPIPRLFGRCRVAGTIIWATDLIEDRRKVSTGKGRPKQTTYSYSANFAVALSARRIGRVGRIWADGKLLRGDGGDFKTQTVFRLYDGSENQSVDPFIASAEGIGNSPAYRGLAYALFEDFQLADYGNRIPSFSFEVIADEGAVPVSVIMNDLGAASADAPTTLLGFAVTGESARGVAESLIEGVTLYVRDDGAELRVTEAATAGPSLRSNDLGASLDDKHVAPIERERRPLSSLPRRRSLAYYDVERDYMQGWQSVHRPDLGNREYRSELAASLTATQARALIERKTAQAVAARDEMTLALPWRYLGLDPAMRLSIPGYSGQWLVRETQLENMVVRLSLSRLAPDTAAPILITDPGRSLFEQDVLDGPTVLHLVDLPWLGTGVATALAVYAVAAGTQTGWRRAGLLQSNDGGFSYGEVGVTAAPAIIGTTASVLGASSGHGFDLVNSVEVELLHEGMALSPTASEGMMAGQNLALIGNELVQFEKVELLSPTRVRLSDLLRGRRGTEAAVSGHNIGERIILIETETLLPLTVPTEAARIQMQAVGMGDIDAVEASLTIARTALQPLSPVHLRAADLANGDSQIMWVRRSRDGWHWVDHVDAPLGEEVERYRTIFAPSVGSIRVIETSSALAIYNAADRAADVLAGAESVGITVQQLGNFGPSAGTSISLSLL